MGYKTPPYEKLVALKNCCETRVMLDRILGPNIASYVKGRGGLIVCAIILTAISAILSVIPAYLFQPFIDKGMMSGSDSITWKIPWIS